MRWATLRRFGRNALLALVILLLAGYLARDFLFFRFLYRGTPADWELSQIPNARALADAELTAAARRPGASPKDVEQARRRRAAKDDELRERCVTLARENSGTRAELTAIFHIATGWPNTQDGANSRERLLALAATADMEHWSELLRTTSEPRDEAFHPLAAALVQRVKDNPGHPAAALMLIGACNMVAPGTDAGEAPPLFQEIADLVVERSATSPDISNFAEHIGPIHGQSPAWAQPFEPHLRRILSVNRDRFVRSSTKIALAQLVQASSESRQPEAEALFEEFLAEFDGKLQYHAQGIESAYRELAERQLATIRSHGLGKPAPGTAGTDLEGRPMTLGEYRGKVVLVSFWATWCYPCMKMIPHEKQVAKRFGPERFAIVGVNSDTDLQAARQAVDRHEITWRSFQSREGWPIARQWHIVGYPTLYLLDADGFVRKRWIGNPPPEALESSIEQLIARASGGGSTKQAAPVARSAPAPSERAGYTKIEVVDDRSGSKGFIGKTHHSSDGKESKYCVFVPRTDDGKTPLPTILFLHGSGFVGNDGRKQLTGALANAIKLREHEFPFLTIFPQAQEGSWQAGSPDGRRVMEILDEVSREYAVDPARVYLTGLSMGGEGTWSLAAAHPGRWAAIVPICGSGDPKIAPRIKDIPCWCFHGDADRPDLSRTMVSALQDAGGRPLYHEYPGVGHNCWDRTYAMPDLYEWMLAQSRGEHSHTPSSRVGKP